MFNPIFMKVQGFLDRATREGIDLDPELIEEFKDNCGKALVKQISRGRGSYSLRMSGLGRPLCQQWHDKNGSDKEIAYNSIMRFLFGDIIEAIAMVILKSSEVNVESEQEKVSLDLKSCKLDGTLDVVIDGKVWDIKSASPYAFSKKFGGEFGGYNKVKEDDAFGYLMQGYLYSKAKNMDFGGWIVIDKASGEWAVCEAPDYQEEDSDGELEKAEKNAKTMTANKPLKKEFADREETFRVQYGKRKGEIIATGNRLMHTICSYCDYKKQCWPSAEQHRRVGTQATQRPIIWYTKLKKREVEV